MTNTTYIPQQFDADATRAMLNPVAAAEAARQAAFQAGYNDGLNKAAADIETATSEAANQVRRTVAALSEAVNDFDNRETTALYHVEDAIIEAAFEIAKAIVQKELSVATDPGAEALARSLQLLPDRTDVIARLNPADAATLNVDNIPTTHRKVEIVADANVEVGGCILEANDTTIDAQLSSVFNNVRIALGLNNAANGLAASDTSGTTFQEPPLS